jgi:hypothetical protein
MAFTPKHENLFKVKLPFRGCQAGRPLNLKKIWGFLGWSRRWSKQIPNDFGDPLPLGYLNIDEKRLYLTI